MSKRALPAAFFDQALSPPGKRLQTEAPKNDPFSISQVSALHHLADNADGIIASLLQLKNLGRQLKEDKKTDFSFSICRQHLAELGRLMAPHLQLLSNPDIASTTSLDALPVLSMGYATAWKTSEITKALPPLPTIKDKQLEEIVFTHPGYASGKKMKHYERLEWLGDAYVEVIATALIHKTFSQLTSGRCSQIRERLVRNTTLAAFFRAYGLETRALLPSELKNALRSGRGSSCDKDLRKTQGDMFEAYTAAIIIDDADDGLRTATDWLKRLWGSSVYEDVKSEEQAKRPVDLAYWSSERSAKEELSARIVVPGITVRYDKINSKKRDRHLDQPLYSVAAYLDGWGESNKFLGAGTALSVKEAGQKAALVALQNRKMIQVYEGKKKAYMDAKEVAAQSEAAAQSEVAVQLKATAQLEA